MAQLTGKPSSNQKTLPKDEAALPSMSSYTLGKADDSTSDSTSAKAQADVLPPGQYCFHKAGNENWLSIRLQLTDKQQITGESSGTVNHPQQGETRYKQTFAGEIAGDRAQVEVTTNIADVTQSQPESWIVSADQLDMGRVVIDKVACPEISANF